MQILNSDYTPLGRVELPFEGRQMHMHEFDLADPVMPKGYEDYLSLVIELCRAAGATTGVAYLTVDEKVVKAGMSQRRPKPHVDGCFMPSSGGWGHSGGGGGWLHTCNDIQAGPIGRMPVIVASSVPGCRVWRGVFEAQPTPDGDLSHIESHLGDGEVLPAGVGYLFSPDCIHESMVFPIDTQRSFLRIALPVPPKVGYLSPVSP